MKNLMEYLNVPDNECFTGVPGAKKGEATRLQVYAMLIGKNDGSLYATHYGIQMTGGLYGITGLDMAEAQALSQMTAFIAGWLEATEGAEKKDLTAALIAEHDRVFALNKGRLVAEEIVDQLATSDRKKN